MLKRKKFSKYASLRRTLHKHEFRQPRFRGTNIRRLGYSGAKWKDAEVGIETSVSNKEVLEFREWIAKAFPKRIKQLDVIRHVPLNQGKEGACTLVGFLNMMILAGATGLLKMNYKAFGPNRSSTAPRFHIPPKDKYQAWDYPMHVLKWEDLWAKCGVGGTSLDIAHTLDGLADTGVIVDKHRLNISFPFSPLGCFCSADAAPSNVILWPWP